ncbi:hypothetical protein YS40_083 [Thermus phage phiYS40]|uniref:hypothetical protein n=1 Tax=Thermus phage phiYS40 TaxID=407392 RepID=UPI0000E689C9|nr:hypothetical protein YS40_083 [Thermus phage phiYS40]ABJ91477.1 hypothetical protein YS40_083 [Thermus phage phiYS40]BAK53601.1 hypothetical protein YSP_083 [Thermus phage phiYS40]
MKVEVSGMKKPIGQFWDEKGYVLVLNPMLVKNILKTIGINRHAEALIVKKRGAEYIEVWEVPFLPYATEYAYRLK